MSNYERGVYTERVMEAVFVLSFKIQGASRELCHGG